MVRLLVLLFALLFLAAGGYLFIAMVSTLRDIDEGISSWEEDDDDA